LVDHYEDELDKLASARQQQLSGEAEPADDK